MAEVVSEDADHDGQEVLCEPGACDTSGRQLLAATTAWLKKEKAEAIVVFEPVDFAQDKGSLVAVLLRAAG